MVRWFPCILLLFFVIPFSAAQQLDFDSAAEWACDLPLPLDERGAVDWRGLSTADRRWPGQVVPFVIDDVGPLYYASMVTAIQRINQQTNVCLVPRTDERDFVFFRQVAGGASSSRIGRVGGEQWILMATDRVGVVVHEIGHALGLLHEHQRPDRDTFVRVFPENIRPRYAHNFEKVNLEKGYQLQGAYDFTSIMHYPTHAFTTNGRPTIETRPPGIGIGQRSFLSALDIATVNAMYPADSLGDCSALLQTGPPIVADVRETNDWSKCAGTTLQLRSNLPFLPGARFLWKLEGGDPERSRTASTEVRYRRPGRYRIVLEILRDGELTVHESFITIGERSLGGTVAPNPSPGPVRLELSGLAREPVQLRVFNSAGQLVWEDVQLLNDDCRTVRPLDFSFLPAGMYFIALTNSEERDVVKLVIHR